MGDPPSLSPDLEDGGNGKKRKYCGLSASSTSVSAPPQALSSLFSAYPSSSPSEQPSRTLRILTQPELQHRARYQTEGSRGSVKDREGSGFPTVQLKGYNGPESKLRLQVFIGSDTGRPVYPHVYYQACKVAGKNSTPSSETRQEGTDVILMDMEADKDFIVRVDCVGILKERYSDIENKIPSQKQRTNWKKKSTKCRMVFRVEIPDGKGRVETLQVVSDAISCSQQPGTPEILKMSTDSSGLSGGGELWMIGKNFLKDAVVVFQEIQSEGPTYHRKPWTQIIPPDKDFFNNSHMIVTVPAFSAGFEPRSSYSVEVSVFVKCGEKTSDSHTFTYREESSSSSSNSSSPKCASPVRLSRTRESGRITILEPVDSRYLTKDEIDTCEDTVFDPEKTQEASFLYRNSIPEDSNSISFSNTNTLNTTTNFNNNPTEDEPPPAPKSSDHLRLTTFSNLFQSKEDPQQQAPQPETPLLVIPKISSESLKAAQKELLKNGGDTESSSKILVNGGGNPGGQIGNSAHSDFLGTNIESKSTGTNGPIYIQGTESDNATISIKLPNSIISNSEKFENVMNTINKALLQPDPTLKSIDSNLARVDISRHAPEQNGVPTPAVVAAAPPVVPAAPQPTIVNGVSPLAQEPSELHPKKQKINDLPTAASSSSSDWLETWNSAAAPSGPTKDLPTKGPTPMDTSPFFTTQEAPSEAPWSEPNADKQQSQSSQTPQATQQQQQQINLSNIIPETVSENWNSVKVEAENWSKTAPTTWSSSVADSWHSPATTVVSTNWPATTNVAPAPTSSTAPKTWSEGGSSVSAAPASEPWPPQHAPVVQPETLVGLAPAGNVPASATTEVVWQTKTNEATQNVETPASASVAASSWQEKLEETPQQTQTVIVGAPTANWDTKKDGGAQAAATATAWFTPEPTKINNLWNEEWSSGAAGSVALKGTVEAPGPAEQQTQHTEPELWTSASEVSNGTAAEKKDLGELAHVVTPFISQEMTPIDPKKVMYDPSPMEVDGVFTKAKLTDYKSGPPNGSSIKGNPLLSESSAIISQQQEIESAIIEPGKNPGEYGHINHHTLKYQPEGLFPLFPNAATASDVQK